MAAGAGFGRLGGSIMHAPRRRLGAFAAALLALASTFVLGSEPAAADTPTVAVTPDRVADGGTVTITTSGFPSGLYAALQCPANAVERVNEVEWARCRWLIYPTQGTPPPTAQATVERTFTSGTTTIDCDTEPGGCVVGILVVPFPESGVNTGAWAPITFKQTLTAQPGRNLADGDTVAVSMDEVPSGEWSVAQCAIADPAQDPPVATESRCGSATPVTLDNGTVSGDVVVSEPLVAVDGTEHTCGSTGCELVLGSVDEPDRATGRISFGPPSITWVAPGPLGHSSFVAVTVAGMPGTEVTVRQCALPASESTCDHDVPRPLDEIGGAVIATRHVQSQPQAADGTQFDCSATPCSLVAESDGTTVVSDPLPLPPPASIAISPAEGLLEGDPITVDITGLTASAAAPLYRCPAPVSGLISCVQVGEVVADGQGSASTTVAASQRLGDAVYCRAQCTVRVMSDISSHDAVYAMAPGSVTVTPNDSLADGDVVRVDGTDLQPTYTGRNFGPFPSGVAAVVQCATTISDATTLFSIFDQCGTNTLALTITAPDPAIDLTVHTDLTTFTGRQIDCTPPGACVAGIARFEQDGTATALAAPLVFDEP